MSSSPTKKHTSTNILYHRFPAITEEKNIKNRERTDPPPALYSNYPIALNNFGALLYSKPITMTVMTVSTDMKLPL